MKRYAVFLIFIILVGVIQTSYQQSEELDMELEVSDEEKIMLFGGFAVAIIAIFLFLARDIILRRKTNYDKENLDSKKDKTFEKYHSDWGDDYEELGKRKNTKRDKKFREAANNGEMPDYYDILGVKQDASFEEIRDSFRELAKKIHPDKTKDEDSEEKMAEINEAYEILSDKENRESYDRYWKKD